MKTLIIIASIVISFLCLKHGINHDEDGKDYLLEKSGVIAVLISVLLFSLAILKLNNPDQRLWLLIYAIISTPMIYTDFQHYHLPILSSILYFFAGIAALTMLTTLEIKALPLSYIVSIIIFVVITLLFGRLRIGIADFYVLATLFVIPLWNYDLSMILSISMVIVSITEILLVKILKKKGFDNFTNNIPYVPSLILMVPVSILLNTATWIII